MKAGTQADKFGKFVMTKLRDAAIDHADALLAAHWKAPGLQSLQNDLRGLSPEQRAIVRRCVVESIDSGLHDFLVALSDGVAGVERFARPQQCSTDLFLKSTGGGETPTPATLPLDRL